MPGAFEEYIASRRSKVTRKVYANALKVVLKDPNGFLALARKERSQAEKHLIDFIVNQWYEERGAEYHGGEAKKYEPDKIRNSGIPIAIGSAASRQTISELVQKTIALRKSLAKTTTWFRRAAAFGRRNCESRREFRLGSRDTV
jgi:hypothetical protein